MAAVFEYTCLRIEACLKQRARHDVYDSRIQETHTTVKKSHDQLTSIEEKLDTFLSLLKKVSGDRS